MKSLLKNEDGPMDRLLRGHLARQSGPKQTCKQFDPDLANAYIEHSLTATEREGFEQHLSLCGDCRTATVVLVRLAGSEAPASSARPATEGWLERLGSLVPSMTAPRWAMAAAAVLVAAVSIPVFMSRVSNRAEQASATPQVASNSAGEADKQRGDTAPAAATADSALPSGLVAQSPATRSTQTATSAGASGGTGTQQPVAAAEVQPAEPPSAPAVTAKSLEQNEKREQEPASAVAATQPSRDQKDQAAPGSQQAPSQPQQQPASVEQLAKVDADGSRAAADAAKDSAHVSVLKSGRPDGQERAAGDTKIRPEDNNAPPSPIAGAESGARRALSQQPSASSLRDGKLNVSGRARATAERKVGKKRFWLRDEVWTDNDYKPEKEMPMVTLVRDSDVFKEVIGKRPTLKGYLTSFTENERAIVVYKGTIYKLIPQDGNK